MSKILRNGVALGIAAMALASVANAQVLRPSTPHAAFNYIPFGGTGQVCTMHQVFDRSLWSAPMEISALGFSVFDTNNGQRYDSDVAIRLGYTEKVPGQNPPTGLDGVLANNPSGSMNEVFSGRVSEVLVAGGTEAFTFVIRFDRPWCYDPAQGNLLVEIKSSWVSGADLAVGRTSGSAEASRAYNSTRFGDLASPTTATRMDFYEDGCSGGGPSLRVTGECPGRVTVAWGGATPNRPMAIVYANNTGSFVVPGGPCAGTQLGLGTSGIQVAFQGGTGSGSGQVNSNVGTGVCGHYIQMVVVSGSPCETSNVVQLP